MAWFKNLRGLFKKQESCMCMVVSEQENAEIWINNKKTNNCTPSLIAIPKNEEVLLTIKLIGHKDHSVKVRSSQNLTYYYCQLERMPFRLICNEIYHHTSV